MTFTGIMLITTQLSAPLSFPRSSELQYNSLKLDPVVVQKREPVLLPDLRLKLSNRIEVTPTIEAGQDEHLSGVTISIAF